MSIKFIKKYFLFTLCLNLLCSLLCGATNSLNLYNNNNYNTFTNTGEKDIVVSEKIVYLTFDDGPSKNTPLILDILAQENVKATFFVIGPYVPSHNDFVKRAYDEGHSIGNHTFDHEFKDVYASEDIFWKNFNKQQDFIKSITGYPSTIFRFPGGSRNTIVRKTNGKDFTQRIIRELNNQGVHCYDWNVDSGDGRGNNIPPETLLSNVKKELGDKQIAIVLMHDCMTKTTTVKALPSIIKYFKDQGYSFRTL